MSQFRASTRTSSYVVWLTTDGSVAENERMSVARSASVTFCAALMTVFAAACGSFSSASDAPATDGGPDGDMPGSETSTVDAPGADAGDAGDAGVALELARGLVDLSSVAATETTVFVAERTPGRVRSIPIGGGSIGDVSTNAGSPTGLAVTTTDLFWCNYGGKELLRQPLAGGLIVPHTTSTKNPFQIAIASDRVVTVTLDGVVGAGEIQQYAFDFTAGPSVGIATGNPYDVAALGTDFYWTESATGRIGRGQTGVSTNKDLVASGESDCQSIAVDSAGVYWARPSNGLIRTAVTGNASDLATNETAPHSLAADGQALYWLTGDGQVRRSTHMDRKITTLATGYMTAFTDGRAQALALTSKYVVWLTTDGRVMRVAK